MFRLPAAPEDDTIYLLKIIGSLRGSIRSGILPVAGADFYFSFVSSTVLVVPSAEAS